MQDLEAKLFTLERGVSFAITVIHIFQAFLSAKKYHFQYTYCAILTRFVSPRQSDLSLNQNQ